MSAWHADATGPTLSRFLDRQSIEVRESLKQATQRILSRCAPPEPGNNSVSQIIVGEVQSGKTMSFTAAMAMGRDNGYAIVILIAGTKENLYEQTKDRLAKDLALEGDGGLPSWHLIAKPPSTPRAEDVTNLAQLLVDRQDVHRPEQFKRTALIVTLKSSASLRNVARLLEKVSEAVDLTLHPTLIVDDEADQASPNLHFRTGDESAVYAGLSRVRESCPNHSLLMYTATPQAPLLLHLDDHLSPDFVTLLKAGRDYIGGRELFIESSLFARDIPTAELQIATAPAPDDLPPKSLSDALALFAVALVYAQQRQRPQPLSMLIHPATRQAVHRKYQTWVKDLVNQWILILRRPAEPGYDNAVQAIFGPAFRELLRTCESLASVSDHEKSEMLKQLLEHMPYYLDQVGVEVVNSTKDAKRFTEQVWKTKPGWILVGGAKLDRGFTVVNLAVTYMPRSSGVGNADSLQQRGRFFGYKRPYADLLRGWFNPDVRESFTQYVQHEESMRDELGRLDRDDQPLHTWRRRFLLDPALKPTRRAVISMAVSHQAYKHGSVFYQKRLYDPALASSVPGLLARLQEVGANAAQPHPRDTRRNPEARHLSFELPTTTAVGLLADWVAEPEERWQLSKIAFAVQALIDEGKDLRTQVVLMDGLNKRRRGLATNLAEQVESSLLEIGNIYAGRSEDGTYGGDLSVCDTDALTIQVHRIAPTGNDLQDIPQRIRNLEVLALAILWPNGVSVGVLEGDAL